MERSDAPTGYQRLTVTVRDATRMYRGKVVPLFPSLNNLRLHWRELDGLKKKQKRAVEAQLAYRELPPLPVVVTMTRVGPRALDDDNLKSSMKYVRDTIAKFYGVDDASELYDWRTEQRKGEYALEITIESV
jgi:hypothetical protein